MEMCVRARTMTEAITIGIMFLSTVPGYCTAMQARPVPHFAVPYAAPMAEVKRVGGERRKKFNGGEIKRSREYYVSTLCRYDQTALVSGKQLLWTLNTTRIGLTAAK